MKTKTAIILFAIFLILIQLISYIGMQKVYVGLYPEITDMLYPNFFYSSGGPVIRKLFFAVQAGINRFSTSFSDLTFNWETDYYSMNATQMVSAYCRDSLRNYRTDYNTYNYLWMYDIILTVSYCIPGLTGLALLKISKKVKN